MTPALFQRMAQAVAQHYHETVEPMGYKAFLVAVDREACTFSKGALDRHLPPDYSTVVISASFNDPPELAAFHLSEEAEQRVRTAFRKPDELPKILIVTEKLLTGYDAPILYCLYLDKPMRDHVLLQAIARVNRPYEDDEGRRKTAGFVLDFVGIFDKLERALAFDSDDVSGVIEGIDILQQRCEELMAEGWAAYLPVWAGLVNDKAAEAVLEHFRDREPRDAFYRYYRELEELYEILSPDPFLRPFLADYAPLTRMYRLVRAAYEPHVAVDKSFLRKTAKLVQRQTETTALLGPTTITKLDVETLEKLARQGTADTVKVFNLLKVLHTLVEEEGQQAPHLIPIGERAEQIARAFEARQLTTQDALRHLEELVGEYREADASRQSLDLSLEGFAVFWRLRREGVGDAEHLARKIAEAFARSPHWDTSGEQEREVRKAIYMTLLAAGMERVVELADRLLTMLRKAGP